MTELYTLLTLLVVICLAECICYAPEGTSAFRLYGRRRAKLTEPLFRLGSLGLEVFGGSPIPGRGEIAFCGSEPRLSPLGLCICNLAGHRDQTSFIPFSEIADLRVDGSKIFSGTHLIAQANSDIRAHELSNTLRRLISLDSESRSLAIRKEFRRMLAVSAARGRWNRFNRVTRWLDWNARLLLAVLLFVLPTTIFFAGWRQALPMAAFCLLLSLRQIFIYVRIHRVFHRDSISERRMRALTLTLSPPAAVRIRDYLSRDLFASFHSLAVARATCDETLSRDFASKTLRRLLFPADFEKPNMSCPVAVWFDHEWLSAVQEWATGEFGDARSLLAPPQRQHGGSFSYCPRCLEQFVNDRAECPDCPGVWLRTFDAIQNTV